MLNLLGSLGTQFNAKYDARAVNSTLLSVFLFIAGSATLVLTLLPLCDSPRRRQRLRPAPLLGDADEPSSSSQYVAPSDPAINSAAGPSEAGDSFS